MRKSSFTGYVYDFSVGYNAIDVDDIKDIHKYLMKKNNSVNLVFFIGLTILSSFTNTNSLSAIPLSCISMNN